MEPYLMNCVVCLSSNNLHKFGVFGKRKIIVNDYEEADENRCVDNQVQVIFLLRYMLDIPNGVCTKFFQEYGNPSSWIYCCSSCSGLVDKARNVFDDMALLQKKFEKLQTEMKEAIVLSVNSEDKVSSNQSKKGPKEVIRSYITKEYYGNQNEQKIKEEPQDYEDMDAKSDLDYLDWSPVQTSDDNDDMEDDDYVPSGNINSYGSEDMSNMESGTEFAENLKNNDTPYTCDICGKGFTQKGGLTKHLLIHAGKRLHECNVCQKRFTQSGSLAIHYRIHTGERPYKCQYCGKGFPESDRLKCHIRSHTGEKKPIQCEICNRRYSNFVTFENHMKTHEVPKSDLPSTYKCQVCGEEFSETTLFVEHSKAMHDLEITIHKCETCSKSFVDLAEFELHKNSSCTPLYSCGVCTTQCSSLRGFQMHLRTHEYNDDDLTCQICAEKFAKPYLLTFHLKKEHADEVRTFPCKICGKKFLRPSKLKRHMTVHSDVRSYECKSCGRKFKNAYSLTSHMKIHNGDSPYKCDICGEGFRMLNHLNCHIAKQHTLAPIPSPILPTPRKNLYSIQKITENNQEKSSGLESQKKQEFLCYNCGQKYPNEDDLKEHVKTHAGEFPIQCDCCGKHFIHNHALKIHYRDHTGERPYKCEFCEKTFKQSVSLILHRRTHTGEKPYPCTVCGKLFSQSSHLYRHQNTHLNKDFTVPS